MPALAIAASTPASLVPMIAAPLVRAAAERFLAAIFATIRCPSRPQPNDPAGNRASHIVRKAVIPCGMVHLLFIGHATQTRREGSKAIHRAGRTALRAKVVSACQ